MNLTGTFSQLRFLCPLFFSSDKKYLSTQWSSCFLQRKWIHIFLKNQLSSWCSVWYKVTTCHCIFYLTSQIHQKIFQMRFIKIIPLFQSLNSLNPGENENLIQSMWNYQCILKIYKYLNVHGKLYDNVSEYRKLRIRAKVLMMVEYLKFLKALALYFNILVCIFDLIMFM